jgi:hypothetical protein
VRTPFPPLLAVVVTGGFLLFAKGPATEQRVKWLYRLIGAVHGLLHCFSALVIFWALAHLLGGLGDILFNLLFYPAVAVVGGLWSSELVGLYLLATNRAPLAMHDNEAFSALHHPGFKHFLRMHIDASGLKLTAIGLERVGRQWPAVPGTGDRPPCKEAEAVYPTRIYECTIEPRPVTL